MDLRKFYLDNVNESEYYYKFYELINEVNFTYNVFHGKEKTHNYDFDVFDIEEAIDRFKKLCQPEYENHDKEDCCWFYVILFYLYKNDYYIEEFPRLIERPPLNSYEFVNRAIRNRIIEQGNDENGTVHYADRRKLIASFTFKQKTNHIIEIDEEIENIFRIISNRNASFNQMTIDEKLAEIINSIELLLKNGKKFITPDYSKACFQFINEQTVKDYRKMLQCFRHASTESLNERATFSEMQKLFLIDYGLTILKVIYYLNEEDKNNQTGLSNQTR